MDVAVKHNRAVVLILIERNRVVAQNNKPTVVVDFGVIADAFPMESKPSVDAVVVSLDEMLVTVKPFDDGDAAFLVLPKGIAEDIDRVLFGHPLIPVVYQNLVHQIRVGKRAVIKADDVFMAEMHIGNVVNQFLSSLSSPGCSSVTDSSMKQPRDL